MEVFELTTRGGATDFEQVVRVCESSGPYCLIGGLAVNCYVEPVYTLDANFVIAISHTANVTDDAQISGSQLRIQFTKDARYQDFPARAIRAEVLGIQTRIASLEDLTQGKLWAYTDPRRRLSKRQKDRADLIRLAEAFPELIPLYTQDLRDVIADG